MRLDKKERTVPDYGDFEFIYPVEIIAEFYWEWRASEHRLTPDGKGWLDQDEAFWSDVWTYDALVTSEEQKRKKPKKGQ